MVDIANIGIGVNTTGIRSGVTELRNFGNEARQANQSAQGVTTAAQKMQQEFERLVNASNKQNTATQKIIQSQNQLQRELKQTEAVIENVTRAQNAGAGALAKYEGGLIRYLGTVRNSRAILQNFSFQIQDIAVQLAAGTSLTQTLGQQLPQLAGGFGATGAAIGAVIAVLGGLAPLLYEVFTSSDDAEKGITSFDDALKDMIENTNKAAESLALLRSGFDSIEELRVTQEIARLNTRLAEISTNRGPDGRNQRGGAARATEREELRKEIAELEKRLELLRRTNEELASEEFVRKNTQKILESDAKFRENLARQGLENVKAARAEREKAERERLAEIERQEKAAQRLADRRKERVASLELERDFNIKLTGALKEGENAVAAVKDEYEAEQIIRQLKLEQLPAEAEAVRTLVKEINEQERAQKALNQAEQERQKSARARLREIQRAQQEAQREAEKTLEDIDREAQRVFGEIVDGFGDGFEGVLETAKSLFSKWLLDLAYEAAIRPIVLNIASQTLGLGGAIGGAGSAGGGLGGILDIGSSLINAFTGSTGGIASSFALSGIGQALGLSSTIAIPGAAGGAIAAGAASTTALTGLGSALVAAAPFLAVAAAALPFLLGSGLFGGKPSSGPTGIAITSNILEEGVPDLITGQDNGGDAQPAADAIKTISKVTLEIERQLSGAVRKAPRSFGLDIGYYSSPEAGSGRERGFTIQDVVNEVKTNVYEQGLTGEEVIVEGVKRTLLGAFETLGDPNVTKALQNTVAETLEELLSDIDFALNFDEMFTPAANVTGQFTSALDALETQFQEAKEKSDELGLATSELQSRYDTYVQTLKNAFATELNAEVAGVGGEFGGLLSLAQSFAELQQDAETAGISTSLLASVIDSRFSAAIEGLSQNELQVLLTLFRQLPPGVAGASTVIAELEEELGSLADSEGSLVLIREEQLRAMKQFESELSGFVSQAEEAARNLRRAADGLLIDPTLSPLTPGQRLDEARRQFEEALKASQGNPEIDETQRAIATLPGISEDYLNASREYYSSSEAYQEDFQRVQDALLGTAEEQESYAARQLNVLEAIRDALLQADASASSQNFGSNVDLNRRLAGGTGYSGDFGQGGFQQFIAGQSESIKQIARAILIADGQTPGFANGGVAGGGFAIVGERGPELVNFQSTARVFPTEMFMGSMNQNASELVSLRGEVARLTKVVADLGMQQIAVLQSIQGSSEQQAQNTRLATAQ